MGGRVHRERAIGVFDSGVGGLTVASAIARALPDESLLYLGDTARVPYGTRSPETVLRYAHNNATFLEARGIKLLVVACNTVSATALEPLAESSPVPVLGVIEPGAEAAVAASTGGEIAVLVQIPCPLFVPLAEEGWTDHEVTRAVAREYLAPLAGRPVDTIILGCTHYPILAPAIARAAETVLGHTVAVVDSAGAAAEEVARHLADGGLASEAGPGQHRFCVTDEPARLEEVAARFWGGALPAIEHVDVPNVGPSPGHRALMEACP
jgi:glutamate racemase